MMKKFLAISIYATSIISFLSVAQLAHAENLILNCQGFTMDILNWSKMPDKLMPQKTDLRSFVIEMNRGKPKNIRTVGNAPAYQCDYQNEYVLKCVQYLGDFAKKSIFISAAGNFRSLYEIKDSEGASTTYKFEGVCEKKDEIFKIK